MAINADPSTLTRFILTEQKRHPGASGDLSLILSAIATACKAITAAVRRVGLVNLYGMDGSTNATGDDVKKLDILSNEIWVNALKHTGRVAILATEEAEEVVILSDHEDAKYGVVFDPLDGSSNIDCNVSVGSIFGIYRRPVGRVATVSDLLQPGSALVCAGYCMYGSSTELVLTFGDGVHMFSYDPTIGEFLLTRRDVTIPAKPQRIYSCNEANYASFPKGIQRFLDYAKSGDKPYSLRYVGSMVADVHRTLLYGGVFCYAPTKAAPAGKLRLLYEVNPMSFIMEQAGGKATTGTCRALDLVPTKVHQRCPIYLGCVRDVDLILSFLADEGEAGHGTPSVALPVAAAAAAAAAASGGGEGGAAGGAGAPAS